MKDDAMTVLITGGGGGIGRSVVMRFAQGGYNCIFTYNKNNAGAEETQAMVRKQFPKVAVQPVQLDIQNSDQVDQVIDTLLQQHANIHVLVNNAAIIRNTAAVLMSDEEWQQVIETNLSGTFYITRALLVHFLSNRFGRIVTISSPAAQGAAGQINYSASKAGLEGMTYTLSREYGSKNITANGVSPGLIDTDMLKSKEGQKLIELWNKYCPMHRLGTPEEIASAVFFLASNEASFINGQIIYVTGGLNFAPF